MRGDPAHLFALDPTEVQEHAFRSHCGAQRYTYNWGLALVRANLDQRAAERSYGVAEDDLTPLTYKAAEAGVRVVVADRWYPSSKTCSACGAVRAKLLLSEREFVCDTCGTRLDRDWNAALNLAALAAEVTSSESVRRDAEEPAGNPHQTAIGGNGYRHGKAQIMSQGRLREVATP